MAEELKLSKDVADEKDEEVKLDFMEHPDAGKTVSKNSVTTKEAAEKISKFQLRKFGRFAFNLAMNKEAA